MDDYDKIVLAMVVIMLVISVIGIIVNVVEYLERRHTLGKSKFYYDGPVTQFDRVIMENWHGETWAVTEAKALSNLSYQFKTQFNMSPGSQIELYDDYMREVSAIDG